MIFEKIRAIIAEQFGIDEDEITMDTNFVEDLDADSLDLVEVMMSVEDTFHIEEIDEDLGAVEEDLYLTEDDDEDYDDLNDDEDFEDTKEAAVKHKEALAAQEKEEKEKRGACS